MGRRLRLGTFFGVEVAADEGWVVTFVLAAWTLVAVAARILPDAPNAALVGLGVAAAVGLFASLVVHELAYGAVARACGVPVRHVTLFLLGGVTDVERAPASPRSVAIAALTAPLANATLAVVLLLATALGRGPLPGGLDDLHRLGPAGVAVLCFGFTNVAVAAIHVVPAYPLDGGRVVRAALWAATGDVERATRWAAWSGQLFGWLLLVVGVGLAVVGAAPIVLIGVWVAFSGWLLASSAARGYEAVVLQDTLAGVPVAWVMKTAVETVPAELSVASAMRSFFGGAAAAHVPVVDGGRLVGAVAWARVRRVPPEAWATTSIRQLAHGDVRSVAAQRAALEVLDVLANGPAYVVDEERRLVGVLESADVRRFVERRGGEPARRAA